MSRGEASGPFRIGDRVQLTGPKGRGARRAEEAGPHRPEPKRFAEL